MTHPKTEREMVGKLLSIFPNATWGVDNDGQVIIYTDLSASWSEETQQTVLTPLEETA